MSSQPAVIIIGAGPVGLGLAFRLGSFDIPTLVLEAEDRIADQLRASTFHPPTLDMLDDYGLGAALVARGRITPTWQIRMHETGERAEFDLSVLSNDTDHPYRLQAEQHKLSYLFLDRLDRMPQVEIRFGAPVTAAGQDDLGAWVTTAAPDGTETRHRAAFVVGCDGARSEVRKAIGQALKGETYPETTVLATTTTPFEDRIDGLSGVNYIWMGHGTYSLLHLPDLWRCSFHPKPGQTAEQAATPEAVQAAIAEILGEDPPFDVREVRPYRVHARIVDDYRRGRIVLAGDAAHLNSPKGGMGMNGGLHDAWNLSDKLFRILHRGASTDLLDLYTRQRRPIAAEEIIAQADQNRKRMNETDPAKRRAHLARLQETAEDPDEARTFLLRSSMITGLRRAEALAA